MVLLVMQQPNMQLNKATSMYNFQDDVDSLKNELEFDRDSIDDLHRRVDRLRDKQNLIVSNFESLVD
jgi:hypothetical protein